MTRLKAKPGQARFDFKLNLGHITPEQAEGFKWLSAATHEMRGYLSPKQANLFLDLMVQIHKENAEQERADDKNEV